MDIDFAKGNGLVPVIIQDARTQKILMLGFMNEEAYHITTQEKIVTFFSRDKQRLWTKGETSGNILEVKEILLDCDHDTLLIKVIPTGPTCHLGHDTCFQEDNSISELDFCNTLINIIRDRKDQKKQGSYTSSLFEKGLNRIAQKVGEEAVELIIESKDDNPEKILNESADLFYHFLVLLEAKGLHFRDVMGILKERHKEKLGRK